MRVKFLLVCEGSSDRGLVPHLEALCVRAGASEAMGDAPDLGRLHNSPGRAVESKAQAVLQYAGDVNLLFIHEDADSRDPDEVRQRILERISAIEQCPPHVCVVPVQELESWLLADEAAIRAVVGSPRGTSSLDLPASRRIESTPRAKERLELALVKASGETGQRLQRLKARFPEMRAMLLQRLDIDGPVKDLPAWRRLVADVNTAVRELLRTAGARKRSSGSPRS